MCAAWICTARAKAQIDSSTCLHTQGESFTLDRKSNLDGIPIIVPRPYLCVVGSLTPDMLVEFEDEQGREDGFVDRFLWTFPDVPKVVYWTAESVL